MNPLVGSIFPLFRCLLALLHKLHSQLWGSLMISGGYIIPFFHFHVPTISLLFKEMLWNDPDLLICLLHCNKVRHPLPQEYWDCVTAKVWRLQKGWIQVCQPRLSSHFMQRFTERGFAFQWRVSICNDYKNILAVVLSLTISCWRKTFAINGEFFATWILFIGLNMVLYLPQKICCKLESIQHYLIHSISAYIHTLL